MGRSIGVGGGEGREGGFRFRQKVEALSTLTKVPRLKASLAEPTYVEAGYEDFECSAGRGFILSESNWTDSKVYTLDKLRYSIASIARTPDLIASAGGGARPMPASPITIHMIAPKIP